MRVVIVVRSKDLWSGEGGVNSRFKSRLRLDLLFKLREVEIELWTMKFDATFVVGLGMGVGARLVRICGDLGSSCRRLAEEQRNNVVELGRDVARLFMAFKPPTIAKILPFTLSNGSARISLVGARKMQQKIKWENVDEKLAKLVAETSCDHAPERRKLREAFKDVQLGIDHCLLKLFTIIKLYALA